MIPIVTMYEAVQLATLFTHIVEIVVVRIAQKTQFSIYFRVYFLIYFAYLFVLNARLIYVRNL
jgi:hypothetical protein